MEEGEGMNTADHEIEENGRLYVSVYRGIISVMEVIENTLSHIED